MQEHEWKRGIGMRVSRYRGRECVTMRLHVPRHPHRDAYIFAATVKALEGKMW